jgi:Tol biopolymer transport system component
MDTGYVVFDASACRPGDTVLVARVLENNSPNLWRLTVATGELKQLTYAWDVEKRSWHGKWVVYTEEQATDVLGQIFKISVDGGIPVELAHGTAFSPVVSPDGKLIAYGRTDGQGASAKSKIVVQKTTPSQKKSNCLQHTAGTSWGGRRMDAPSLTFTIRRVARRMSTCSRWLVARHCS